MACDPQTLMTQAKCLVGCIPPAMQLPVLISLMCQIQQNGTLGGVSQLLAGSNITLTPASGTGVVTIAASGGGGGNQVSGGVGPPTLPPTNTAIFNVWIDTSTGNQFWWNPNNSTWN